MDPAWDHTENEDKLLIAHTSRMGTFMDMNDNMYGTDNVMSVPASCCNNDRITGGGDGIDTVTKDYIQHILSIVINNYNLLFGLSPSPFKFPLLIHYINQLNCLYCWICKISNICNSEPQCKCKCTCSCNSNCTSCTICLCMCDNSKGEGSNGCFICICKKQQQDNCNCNCICICICVCKKANQCCCQSKEHQCKECLIKVDINSLLIQTWKISGYLNCIKCYISRLENKSCSTTNSRCCCCSCCPSGCSREKCESYCCCKDGAINYSSIISKISIVVILFKEVGKKILDLTKLYKTPPLKYIIEKKCKPCESCGCKDKLKELTGKIQKVVDYYSSFASIIGEIKSLVDYKTFCPQANEIIEKLNKSVRPLLIQLSKINSQVLGNVGFTTVPDELLVVVYSHYSIFQCFLAMYILLQSSSMSYSIFNVLKTPNDCECAKCFDKDNKSIEKFTIKTFDENICSSTDLKKLVMNNEGNHLCLCLVIKYILYPNLIKSMYYLRQVYMETLSIHTRDFIQNNYSVKDVNYVTKLIYSIILLLDKITLWIKEKYYYAMRAHRGGVDIICFCMYSDDPYYSYLISIILYVSSMIENIWTMDIESLRIAIECLSSLLAEYQSIHVYTKYYSPSRHSILRNIVSVLGSGKIIEGTLSHSGGLVGDNKQSLVRSTVETRITRTEKGSGKTTSVISTGSSVLLNKSTKSGFMSLRTLILGTEFSKEKFTLLYGKYSQLSFYTQNSNISIARMQTIRNPGVKISLDYLEKICQKPCEQTCCQKSRCKICPIAKIRMRCLSISFKDMGLIIGNVSGDMLLNYMKISISRSRDFMANLCVGFGEVYTIMLKNLLIWSRYPMNIIKIENIGVTNVETRNWGYDTKYEHDVSNEKGLSEGYPNLNNLDRSFIQNNTDNYI